MKPVYIAYGTIVSPLGTGKETHLNAFAKNLSGVKKQLGSGFNGEDWFLGKIESLNENRYDHLLEIALDDLALECKPEILSSEKTLFILSSTKGNLNALPEDTFASTRRILNAKTQNPNEVIIISNACISGVMAVNTAADYLRFSNYEDVIVIGIDALFDFVVYGFQSLYALSNEPCKPYDKDRKGISIGEACGILRLSTRKPSEFSVNYLGGASSNDANHISGPSRTGEGLFRAIQKSFLRAACSPEDIDFISAHGTATVYNDEMESIAFYRSDLTEKPVNSMKGYFGHTLGAAGIIEIYMTLCSMEQNTLYKNLGYENQGTTYELNILTENSHQPVATILKTASGFGGGNAALILQKTV